MSKATSSVSSDRTPNDELAEKISTSLVSLGLLSEDGAERMQTQLKKGEVTSEQWRTLAASKVRTERSAGEDQSADAEDATT